MVVKRDLGCDYFWHLAPAQYCAKYVITRSYQQHFENPRHQIFEPSRFLLPLLCGGYIHLSAQDDGYFLSTLPTPSSQRLTCSAIQHCHSTSILC